MSCTSLRRELARKLRPFIFSIVLASCLTSLGATAPASQKKQSSPSSLSDVLRYISAGWNKLTRVSTSCATVADPKTPGKRVLYLPMGFDIPAPVRELANTCKVQVENLPAAIQEAGGLPKVPPGLLFLPNPYVVPGGMFNEMYGWDSYFIIRGLLREGQAALAKGMVENFFFEIDHYGAVLNANRTYYLTRSQPPFLSSMILAVFDAEKAGGKEDVAWLARAYRFAVKDYEMWTREPHLAGDTGLSRYYDHGEGPVPELSKDALPYYRGVIQYFLVHRDAAQRLLSGTSEKDGASPPIPPLFAVTICDPGAAPGSTKGCARVEEFGLTAEFYKGDRSMRESGFDVTFRFGPFGARTHHYAPVCLNSLLYKTETDLERIATVLRLQKEAGEWRRRAKDRQNRIEKYLWDGHKGLFFDYDLEGATRSSYEYATTFYPLWAGAASPFQAQAVVRNLALFFEPGGLTMSHRETAAQWDYPYGWAPIQLLAAEGLRRYGFNEEANRISYNFLATVLANFVRDGTIREKYNVVTRSSETKVAVGYKENVIGFGWTNGVFLELLKELPREWAARLEAK